jgi:toxin ParE1/3/4
MSAKPLAIRRTAKARADLLEIWLYLAERGPAVADRVLDAIERLLRLIALQPLMGRERPELSSGIRSFVVMSWVVFYRVRPDAIEVVRVLHGARDLDAIEF